jgi:hypothetical protein
MKNSLFENFQNEKIENLNLVRGGLADGTREVDAATLKTLDGGCQQADVRKNDNTSNVGEPSCPDVAFFGGASAGTLEMSAVEVSAVSYLPSNFLSTN